MEQWDDFVDYCLKPSTMVQTLELIYLQPHELVYLQ